MEPIRKSTQNPLEIDPDLTPHWHESTADRPCIDPNDSKLTPNGLQIELESTPSQSIPNRPRIGPGSTPNQAQMDPKSISNRLRMNLESNLICLGLINIQLTKCSKARLFFFLKHIFIFLKYFKNIFGGIVISKMARNHEYLRREFSKRIFRTQNYQW